VIGGVLFQCLAPGAKEVCLAGDFNHWVAEPLFRRQAGELWQRVIPLKEGSYRYKYLIDGEWKLDPHAPAQKENFYGNRDSYLELHAD
jgi:1,4-alpha-glucan branching enzyme